MVGRPGPPGQPEPRPATVTRLPQAPAPAARAANRPEPGSRLPAHADRAEPWGGAAVNLIDMLRRGARQRVPSGPASGPQRALIIASFVSRVGNGLFNAAAILYFTLVVHLPATQVGAGLTIAGLSGLAAGIRGWAGAARGADGGPIAPLQRCPHAERRTPTDRPRDCPTPRRRSTPCPPGAGRTRWGEMPCRVRGRAAGRGADRRSACLGAGPGRCRGCGLR